MINGDLRNFLIEYGISESVIDSNADKISSILKSVDPKTSKKSIYGKIARYLSKPDILTQVNNFIDSSIKHLLNNMDNVNEDIAISRISICESCEFFDKNSVRCNSCGCFLKIKTRWASEKCPIGKWGSEVQSTGVIASEVANNGDCKCSK